MADPQVDIFEKTLKWKELAPLPVGRSQHTAVFLDGVIYVGGGFEGAYVFDAENSYRLDAYNLSTNQWSSSPITTPYCLFAMTVLDNKLVTAGGGTKNDEVVKKVLVLNAEQWEDYSEMPTARYNATAVGYHSMLIVVGGVILMEDEPTTLSTTELLDTTSECWYTCNNLPSPHQRLRAAIMNDKLYLLGGLEDRGLPRQVFVASLDTLSTHQLNWQSAPDLEWRNSVPVVVYNKFLLAIGEEKWENVSEVYVLDPLTGQWKHLMDAPIGRNDPAAVAVADDILVMGGSIENGEYTKTVRVGVFE